MIRPVTTLFLLTSVDGKISTGDTDAMDVDTDFPKINGVAQGLYQYYALEQETDLCSFNTGRVMAKTGVNDKKEPPEKIPVSFVILDNKPHLNASGVSYLCDRAEHLYLATSNKNHPAMQMRKDNLTVLYDEKTDLKKLLRVLAQDYGVKRMTIQSGGTINEAFLRQKLLDYVDIVVAPVLIGGRDTPSLIAGESLHNADELERLGVLKLEKCDVLKESYVRLRYRVVG